MHNLIPQNSHTTKRNIVFELLNASYKLCNIVLDLVIVQQDATVFSLLYFCRQLCMFRVLTPIIRSSYNCNYSFWHWPTESTTIRSRCWVGTDSCVSYGKQNIKRKLYRTNAGTWCNKLCRQKRL